MWRYLYDDAYNNSFERMVFTWRDAVKAGRAYAAPYTDDDMAEKMREWGEDSIYWRTEYECEFVESVSNIFNPELLKACLSRGRTFGERGNNYPNCVVGVDIGKSVNSTVISVWSTSKDKDSNTANLIYLEEIGPKSGGHDIPYQRKRIMDAAHDFGADRVIIDATGIGGAIEQEIKLACISSKPQIQFIPFIFTGGPKGSKTQIYRDMASYIQQGQVKVPHPEDLDPPEAKLVNKWLREHIDLQYVMDAANKTEKISAPTGKHDDYCDSTAVALHASLSMLPPSASFASVSIQQSGTTRRAGPTRGIFTTTRRSKTLNKGRLSGL
jgi:hypothetical protein